MRSLQVVALLAALGSPHAAWGAVIASYNLNSNFAPTSTHSNVSATNVGQGGGLSEFDINGSQLRTREWENSSLSTARSAGDFVTFTVTPSAGFKLDLTSLTFDNTIDTGGSSHPPTTFQVGIVINGSETLYSSMATGGGATSISPLALSDITTSAEIRLYAWGGGTTGNRRWYLDNIVLNGSLTPVPEPTTWALAALASVVLWAFRRRDAGSPAGRP